MNIPPHLTPEILRVIELLVVAEREKTGGLDCEEISNIVDEYLASLGIGCFVDWSGTSFDATHTFIRLRDWVVDPTITSFRNAPGRASVTSFPRHPAAPHVALIPASHPLYREYGGHFGSHTDEDLEGLGLGRLYDIRKWTPEKTRVRPCRPEEYRDEIERAVRTARIGTVRGYKGRR